MDNNWWWNRVLVLLLVTCYFLRKCCNKNKNTKLDKNECHKNSAFFDMVNSKTSSVSMWTLGEKFSISDSSDKYSISDIQLEIENVYQTVENNSASKDTANTTKPTED